MVFAEIAEHLYKAEGVDDGVGRIAETAVFTVDGGAGWPAWTLSEQSGSNRSVHRYGRDGSRSSAVPGAPGSVPGRLLIGADRVAPPCATRSMDERSAKAARLTDASWRFATRNPAGTAGPRGAADRADAPFT